MMGPKPKGKGIRKLVKSDLVNPAVFERPLAVPRRSELSSEPIPPRVNITAERKKVSADGATGVRLVFEHFSSRNGIRYLSSALFGLGVPEHLERIGILLVSYALS